MMRDSIHYFTAGVGLFALFFSALFFLVFYAFRWAQSYRYSRGHFVTGAMGVGSMLMLTLVIAVAPAFTLYFLVPQFVFTGLWVGYNDWFFYRFPVPADNYQSARLQLAAPGKDTRFGQFLIQSEAEKPVLFSTLSKWAFAALIVVITGLLGFTRWADAIAWGNRRVVAERQSAKQETKQAVNTAVTSATSAVAVAVDTLQKGYAAIGQKADIASIQASTAAKRVAITSAQQSKYFARKFGQLNANLDRNRQILLSSPSMGKLPFRPPAFGPLPAERVRPVPVPQNQPKPVRRPGKNQAYEGDADSSYYARHQTH